MNVIICIKVNDFLYNEMFICFISLVLIYIYIYKKVVDFKCNEFFKVLSW